MDFTALLNDLAEETGALDRLLATLGSESWHLPTPAEGWSIIDQVSHLAYFDEAAATAANDPMQFEAEADELLSAGPGFTEAVAERYRSVPPPELLDWFRRARRDLVATFSPLDPGTRLPWYGPPMSVASSATARLMETWAHGHDVADALGTSLPETARLRHIAHLGVRTFGFSFANRGLEVPPVEVAVQLTAPDGCEWTWGDSGTTERVQGPAIDFCLVVTQRLHVDESALLAEGSVASQWLELAQAFAGPPGAGRASIQRPAARRSSHHPESELH